ALMGIAERVGHDAATEAMRLPSPRGPRLAGSNLGADADTQVHERLNGLRPTDTPKRTVPAEPRRLNVLGRWDVIVAGGGTAGASAAIAAAREGKSVLVLEYQEALGGIGTVGLISKPYHGLKIGFASDVPFRAEPGGPEYKMEWLRR